MPNFNYALIKIVLKRVYIEDLALVLFVFQVSELTS